MTSNLFRAALSKVKRKIFVSYHHSGDQAYYNAFANKFADEYEVVTDNSLDSEIDSDDVEYVMRRIREEYLTGTSCTIVLVGKDTWGRKYIDWEIKATLDKEHGLIGVQLPTLIPNANGKVVVPDRLRDNIESGYAVWVTWAQFTASADACAGFIEEAISRDKSLIKNDGALQQRNA
ncbi:TIR domain-containing protein [Burkholderia gladioli]|uniref:TIR domain-containing protein n=1 Tax=Burkholderia gladioli TaxID=28095 RepID=UPI001641374F|nr:TIR domain-containing protein [Burkholderia gladioli]